MNLEVQDHLNKTAIRKKLCNRTYYSWRNPLNFGFVLAVLGSFFGCWVWGVVSFKHKSESKSLGLSRSKTCCFSDESLLPLWRGFGKKCTPSSKNVLKYKLKAQNKWNMLCMSGQRNKWLLNMLPFCWSEWLRGHTVPTNSDINPARKKVKKKSVLIWLLAENKRSKIWQKRTWLKPASVIANRKTVVQIHKVFSKSCRDKYLQGWVSHENNKRNQGLKQKKYERV